MVTNAAPVRIVSTSITEQSSSGYRVNVTFSADAGVSRVMMPTWTEANGQDDIVWHQASVSGNTASFYVPVSAHNGESGAYKTQDMKITRLNSIPRYIYRMPYTA